MTELNLDWQKAGTLNDIQNINAQSTPDIYVVYVFVFAGNPKRIIYVGTSNKQHERWKKEQEELTNGKMFIFNVKVQSNSDIYDLMSYKNKGNPEDYYKKLANEQVALLYVPNLEKWPRINDLNKKDDFETNWKNYVTEIYIRNIEIWYAKVNSIDLAKKAEMLIQCRVSSRHVIGYYNKYNISWLGHSEGRSELNNIQSWKIYSKVLSKQLTDDFVSCPDGCQCKY